MIKKGLNAIVLLNLSAITALGQQTKTDKFKLSGFIGPHASGKAYLYYEQSDTIRVDSTNVLNGKFAIAGQVTGPVFARLVFSPSHAVGTRSAILSFFLEPGMIRLSSHDTLKNVIISGSKSDIDFLPIRKALVSYNAELNVLNQAARHYLAVNDTLSIKAVRRRMEKLEEDFKNDTYKKFAKQHLASPVSLYALDQIAGSYLKPGEIEPLFNKLSFGVKDSKAGKAFAARLAAAKATLQDSYLPDFSQPDTSGRLVSLSSFKGKYVLVDLWASWCMPCRAENPGLVKLFDAYQDKNFTILGISLDKNRASWLKAIDADNLTWTQVSDLKYWNNDVAKKFNIRFIPQNILLDPNGKVIARNLHGDKLNEFLAKILE